MSIVSVPQPRAGRIWMALLVATALAWPAESRAQLEPGAEQARTAYDRGLEAHERGDYAQAAKLFAQADELAPNDTALLAAIDAAVLADDAVLTMTLLDRAKQRPGSPEVQHALEQATARFAPSTGRLLVRCAGPLRCQVSVDGRDAQPDRPFWVLAGPRALIVTFGNQKVTKSVGVVAGRENVVDVAPPAPAPLARTPVSPAPLAAAPPPPPAPPKPASTFESPWFWVGAGLTLTFTAASVWSALDLSQRHDAFVADGCDKAATAGCAEAASDGKNAQLRTQLLLGATALAGATTIMLVWLPSSSRPDSGQSAGTALLTARGTF